MASRRSAATGRYVKVVRAARSSRGRSRGRTTARRGTVHRTPRRGTRYGGSGL